MDTGDFHRSIVNFLPKGAYFVDAERRIRVWNKHAETITGFSSEEVVGQFCHANILCHIDKDATPLCQTACPVHSTLMDRQIRHKEVFLRHKEGYRVAVRVSCAPVYGDDGALLGVVEVFEPNSSMVYSDNLVHSLTQLLMTDKLTGLYNRRHGENILEMKINEFKFSNQFIGVAFVDLDDFSRCNNRYGHDTGDKVLQLIAENVSSQIHTKDIFCRWGGEEFLGIFHLAYAGEIQVISDKVRQIIAQSIVQVQGENVSVTASVGSTVLQDSDTVKDIVTRADALMYESKMRGKDRVTMG